MPRIPKGSSSSVDSKALDHDPIDIDLDECFPNPKPVPGVVQEPDRRKRRRIETQHVIGLPSLIGTRAGLPTRVSNPTLAIVDWTKATWLERDSSGAAFLITQAIEFFGVSRTAEELSQFLDDVPLLSGWIHPLLDAFRSIKSHEAVLFLLLCPEMVLTTDKDLHFTSALLQPMERLIQQQTGKPTIYINYRKQCRRTANVCASINQTEYPIFAAATHVELLIAKNVFGISFTHTVAWCGLAVGSDNNFNLSSIPRNDHLFGHVSHVPVHPHDFTFDRIVPLVAHISFHATMQALILPILVQITQISMEEIQTCLFDMYRSSSCSTLRPLICCEPPKDIRTYDSTISSSSELHSSREGQIPTLSVHSRRDMPDIASVEDAAIFSTSSSSVNECTTVASETFSNPRPLSTTVSEMPCRFAHATPVIAPVGNAVIFSTSPSKDDDISREESSISGVSPLTLSVTGTTRGIRHDTTDDEELLELYKHLSGRHLYRIRPDVWTTKGHWSKRYKHLKGEYVKQTKGPGGANGKITHRPFVSLFTLNGQDIQSGFVAEQPGFQRIIISFTRASSKPPVYGLQGMFDRGTVAGRAWSRLSVETPALFISIPRARTASKSPLSEKASQVGEMVTVLDAAPDDMTIELLSVGINGLTTDIDSFRWLHATWGDRLHLRFVAVVPDWFPGSAEAFPIRENGIRYGVFEVSDIAECVVNPTMSDNGLCRELVEIINNVRDLKEDRDDGYEKLVDVTVGRANFRVCPDSEHDSGLLLE